MAYGDSNNSRGGNDHVFGKGEGEDGISHSVHFLQAKQEQHYQRQRRQHDQHQAPDLRKDAYSIAILILLYMIQGVPGGLAFGSIPFLIQSKTSYTQIGLFSLASYPYSLKLLWSPIVDALYIKSFGRRKSWIVPIQLLAGLLLLWLSGRIDVLLFGDNSGQPVNLLPLTIAFFILVLLMATQDVAVDAWSLTMLSKENIGYASTCQTLGLSSGYFLSYTIFLALNSPEFCNNYLRPLFFGSSFSSEVLSNPDLLYYKENGIVSLSGYLRTWGIIYIVTTVLIALFKHEVSDTDEEDEEISTSNRGSSSGLRTTRVEKTKLARVAEVYKKIFTIIKLKNMRSLIVVLLVAKLGFAVSDSGLTALKLVEKGFRRDNMALIVTLAFPFEFIFAVLAGRWSRGKTPLSPWIVGYKFRLFIAALGPFLIYLFPSGSIPFSFYALIFGVLIAYSLSSNIMFVSQGGFFARISDPSIGGTYMTLLNTVSNFGGTWPKFFIYYLVDSMTVKNCVSKDGSFAPFECNSAAGKDQCAKHSEDGGATCETQRDGFYIMSFIMIAVGIVMMSVIRKRLDALQRLKQEDWWHSASSSPSSPSPLSSPRYSAPSSSAPSSSQHQKQQHAGETDSDASIADLGNDSTVDIALTTTRAITTAASYVSRTKERKAE